MTRQFLYSRLAITESPTKVETEKGSERVSRLTPKFTVIRRVAKVRVSPRFNNA